MKCRLLGWCRCRDMLGQCELWMEAKGQPLSNCIGDNVQVVQGYVWTV